MDNQVGIPILNSIFKVVRIEIYYNRHFKIHPLSKSYENKVKTYWLKTFTGYE